MDKVPSKGRLAYLDGLRGLAILGVALFHSFSRWPDAPGLYTPWFARGNLGVELFFLLSGFLIFHSLETSANLGHFLYRRWVRLFPAMALATWLIGVTSFLLYTRTEGLPGYLDVLPGLSFIDPRWWRAGLGLPVTGIIEGDFWTLFIEVKFYVLFGAAFFLFGRRAVLLLVAVALAGAAVILLQARGISSGLAAAVADDLGARYYGWFGAGALFYLYTETKRVRHLLGAAFLGIVVVASPADFGFGGDLLIAAIIFTLFVAPFFLRPVAACFALRPLVFLGFISYPLYLIHENATWVAVRWLHAALPAVPGWLLPIAPLLLLGGVAWLIAAFLEPMARDLLPAWRRPPAARGQPWLTRPRALAALALAGLVAVAATLSLLPGVRVGRVASEAQVLAAERTLLEPMQSAIAGTRTALADTTRARQQAQAYLDGMPPAGGAR